MSTSITVLHVQQQPPEEVERALRDIFGREGRQEVLRIEGTYSAVLRRATDEGLGASYAYLILRPHAPATWTPVLELGNRTEGLEVELSKALGGAAVFTMFTYGDVLSGYRLARGGTEVDRYVSDPSYLEDETGSAEAVETPTSVAIDDGLRGHPERFADLLPEGTAPEDFARVVLQPGWWEEHAGGGVLAADTSTEGEDEDVVDEVDRMRCIGLAMEFWAQDEYPLAQEPDEIPNVAAGPAIALAFA